MFLLSWELGGWADVIPHPAHRLSHTGTGLPSFSRCKREFSEAAAIESSPGPLPLLVAIPLLRSKPAPEILELACSTLASLSPLASALPYFPNKGVG